MVYALIMAVFGQTTIAIHAGVILVNLATAGLVFLLARRMCGDAAGVVAAGTYALLSINPATFGLAAHATHFIMLPALAGIVLLQNLEDSTSAWRIFSAGLLLGLAVIMKQTGVAFGLFAAVWVAWCELSSGNRRWGRLFLRLGWLALGEMCIRDRGNALAAQGRFDEAIKNYRQAIQLNPNYAEALNNLGIALADKGRFGEAIEAFSKAIQINPNDCKVLNNLGGSLADMGQFDEAIENYRKAIQINSNRPETLFHLGTTLGLSLIHI